MRGSDMRTGELFSYVDLEKRVPEHHPLRLIRRIVNEVRHRQNPPGVAAVRGTTGHRTDLQDRLKGCGCGKALAMWRQVSGLGVQGNQPS